MSSIFQPAEGLPVGTILTIALSTAPTGWMLCDGSVVLADTPLGKALLADGYPYGWDGTNPRVPAIQGRTIVGDNGSGPYSVGDTGGVEQVTLTVNQMPSHNHGGTTGDSGDLQHLHGSPNGQRYGTHNAAQGQAGGGVPVLDNAANTTGWADRSLVHSHGIPLQGGGQAHDNMPPFIVLNHIIKVNA